MAISRRDTLTGSEPSATVVPTNKAGRLPRKVLLIISPEQVARVFFSALSSRYDTAAVGWDGPERFSFLWQSNDLQSLHSFRLPPLPRYCVLAYMWLRVLLHLVLKSRRTPFDVIIGIGSQVALLFPILRVFRASERFVYWAGDWFPNDRWWAFLDRKATGMADEVWNITDTVRRARCRALDIPPEHGGAIAGTLFSPPPPFARIAPTGQPYCCYLGRAWAGRGLDLVLEAMVLLRERGVEFALVITGNQLKQDQDYVQGMVTDAGLEKQVRWTGHLSLAELNALLSGSQFGLAVFPGGLSNYSNYTITSKVNHCLQTGVPLVISDSNAMAKEICESGAGLAVGDSASELADAMARFHTDPELTISAGRRAHVIAQRKSSPEWLFDLVEATASDRRARKT